MGGGKGVARRSKAKPPPEILDLTEEDLPIESLQSLTDKKVRHLESKAVSYLEEELRILTSTPGNFLEVARILKILKSHQNETRSRRNGATVRSNSSDQIKSWSLDDK